MDDKEIYLKRMKQAIEEKLWFAKQLNLDEYDLIVDFGCADGTLLKCLQEKKMFSGVCLGYEINESLFDNDLNTITSSWEKALETIENHKKVLVLFSSVLHEVPYLETMRKIDDIISVGVDTICIRDMCYNPFAEEPKLSKRKAIKLFPKSKPYAKKYLGIFADNKCKMLYLLKYKYIENIKTEIEEDYFSTPWADIIKTTAKNDFETVFDLQYTNIYIKKQIKNDFNIDIKSPTHRLLILRKEEKKKAKH